MPKIGNRSLTPFPRILILPVISAAQALDTAKAAVVEATFRALFISFPLSYFELKRA
jgi:hypothetical protein